MKNCLAGLLPAEKQRRPNRGLWRRELLVAIVDFAYLSILLDLWPPYLEEPRTWRFVTSAPCMAERQEAYKVWIFGLRNRARRFTFERRESGLLAMSMLRMPNSERTPVGMRCLMRELSENVFQMRLKPPHFTRFVQNAQLDYTSRFGAIRRSVTCSNVSALLSRQIYTRCSKTIRLHGIL